MKEALDLQPMPWSFMAFLAAFFAYGIWPALRPEHFREECLRNMRPWLRPFAAPVEMIRVLANIWLVMCGFALVLGIASRV